MSNKQNKKNTQYTTNIWLYEYPIWLNHYKNDSLFGLLPKEIIKIIIDIVIRDIIIKRLMLQNLQKTKEQIKIMLFNRIENFHFDDEILVDMDIVKSILLQISKKLDIPIYIRHICCEGKGIMFDYINKIDKRNICEYIEDNEDNEDNEQNN